MLVLFILVPAVQLCGATDCAYGGSMVYYFDIWMFAFHAVFTDSGGMLLQYILYTGEAWHLMLVESAGGNFFNCWWKISVLGR